jgi:metal-sulfur cluster biosynthetic enzyme
MIRRFLEADYFSSEPTEATAEKVTFWLSELRTPELLIEVAGLITHISLGRLHQTLTDIGCDKPEGAAPGVGTRWISSRMTS